ncbi:MAG: PBP1A family penicillin-binding protein, partial [Clostridia bacterium]|nr:PBP1A family penicillin-binding protein [Clostridia bacterium]
SQPLRFTLSLLALIFCIGCIVMVDYLADCYWGCFGGEPLPAWDEKSLMATSSTFIYDSEDNLLAKIGSENRTNISISVLPETVKNAFIASEDIRFYDHFGVDIRGIVRALFVDVTNGEKTQGGSTITQQLVRSCLLNSEKEIRRKVQEAILAIQVERYYSKDEILEMYLNKIYFGEGAYGVESASKIYFGKSASNLSIPEAALLASVIPAPSLYSPFNDYEGAVQRRNQVLNQMADYEFITPEEAEQYKSTDLDLVKSTNSITYNHPYYVDYVLEQLIEIYGNEAVYNQGLTVYTTMSPKVQEICEQVIADDSNFPGGASGPEGAIVVMDPKTGYILGLVGGRKHTSILGWNRAASQPGRQAGSSFKPIIAYAPAIELAGMSPASVINGSPVNYNGYNPTGSYNGYLTMRRALTKSINTVAVRLLQEVVGIDQAIEFASGLGFSIDRSSVGPSLALGTEEVTPLQMAAAYSAFANQGIYTEPLAFSKVVNRSDEVDEYKGKTNQAMSEATAYMMASMMQDVVTSKEGTGNRAQISGWQVAGKTGTTDSGKDIWFVGYTPTLVCSVWMGYDNPTAMNTSYGGTYCAPVFRQVVSQILADQTPVDFVQPDGIVHGYVNGTYDMYLAGNPPKAYYTNKNTSKNTNKNTNKNTSTNTGGGSSNYNYYNNIEENDTTYENNTEENTYEEKINSTSESTETNEETSKSENTETSKSENIETNKETSKSENIETSKSELNSGQIHPVTEAPNPAPSPEGASVTEGMIVPE